MKREPSETGYPISPEVKWSIMSYETILNSMGIGLSHFPSRRRGFGQSCFRYFEKEWAKRRNPRLKEGMNSPARLPAVLLLLCALGVTSLHAEVKLASPFTSHMVLQRDIKVPVWGTADPGEAVTVDFAGQKKSATADTFGAWRVDLDPLDTSDQGRVFTVTGTKSASPIQLDDVLVGEVWLASGQSNMDFSISAKVKSFAGVANEEAEIAAANYPAIRIFTGTATRIYEPQSTVGGEWEVCSPQTAPAFSAVSYFFARDLQKGIKAPVGIITMAFGASTAEAWIRREALADDPELKPMLDRFDAAIKTFRLTPPASVAPPPSEDVSNPGGSPAASATPPAALATPPPMKTPPPLETLASGTASPTASLAPARGRAGRAIRTRSTISTTRRCFLTG